MNYATREDLAGNWRPTLGPCRCRGCGASLWWARRNSRVKGREIGFIAWRNIDGTLHKCRRQRVPSAGVVRAAS